MVLRSDLNEEPELSGSNNLVTVINWLRHGDYVVLYDGIERARFFCPCCSSSAGIQKDTDIDAEWEKRRTIFLDVGDMHGLLDEGEWEWYIKNEGFKECQCVLWQHVNRQPGVKLPHSYFFKL